jgi:Flp pilus assembly protein TadD
MELSERAARCYAEGLRLSCANQASEALTAFQEAAQLCPKNPEYQLQVGLSCERAGYVREAALAFGQAIELAPESLQAWIGLTRTFRVLGEGENAIRAGQTAVKLGPEEPSAYVSLAKACAAQGESAQAGWALSRALALHLNATQKLGRSRRFPAAWKHVNEALNLVPNHPHAHFFAGVLCLGENDLDAAAVHLNRAIELQPDRPEFWSYRAQLHLRRRSLPEADRCLARALELDPENSDGRYLKGWLELSQGRLTEGWPKLEPRWIRSGPRDPQRAQWAGEPLEGRTILLYLNHGFGDTLHFVRYAPLVAARGGKVVLECSPALQSLLQGMEGVEAVIRHGQPLPPFDVQASLLSLPRILGTTLNRIPSRVPYLRLPSPCRVSVPARNNTRLKVGLVWGGSELLIFDQNRSVPLSALAPLLALPEVAFYSLQVGSPSRQLREGGFADRIIDLGPQLTDFAATASAIGQLDLVITVDTSVAHLAGALGKPVWMLLLFFADWRWLYDRDDSPWYPTMRLFRQTHFQAGWDGVVERVRDRLGQCLEGDEQLCRAEFSRLPRV